MKTREEIMNKLEKLLALSESDNEAEAESALLTAHKLMAKYKIGEAELGGSKKQEVKWIYSPITYSGRRDSWISSLANTIASNMCCVFARQPRGYRSQTYSCVFIGLGDDVLVCNRAFEYAVEFVQSYITDHIANPLMKKYKVDYRTKQINEYATSFGYGFASGLRSQFDKQKAEAVDSPSDTSESVKTYAMVMVVPQEVKDNVEQNTRPSAAYSYAAWNHISSEAYMIGREEGSKFDVNRKFVEDAVSA